MSAAAEVAGLRRMRLVTGNRNQLQWDLPALDSLELHRAIYRLPREGFRRTRDELVDLLEIGDLVRKPVRQLSLGERTKAAQLLHPIHSDLAGFAGGKVPCLVMYQPIAAGLPRPRDGGVLDRRRVVPLGAVGRRLPDRPVPDRDLPRLAAFTRWFWRFGLRRYSGASA